MDIESIRKSMEQFEKDYPDKKSLMKNHRWTGEDGTQYSSWDISTPGMTIHTGDGGAIMMMKAFEKALKEMKNKFGKSK